MKKQTALVPFERIASVIYLVRGQKVMLDRELAMLYGVETRVLNQAVKRNRERFPSDFMLELTRDEIRNISQSVISSAVDIRTAAGHWLPCEVKHPAASRGASLRNPAKPGRLFLPVASHRAFWRRRVKKK